MNKIKLRAQACRSPHTAYHYARHLDGPHDDTRNAASVVPSLALRYARWVDGAPHKVTRAGVVSSPEHAYRYAMYVDRCFRGDTWAAVEVGKELGGTLWSDLYRIRFLDPVTT